MAPCTGTLSAALQSLQIQIKPPSLGGLIPFSAPAESYINRGHDLPLIRPDFTLIQSNEIERHA